VSIIDIDDKKSNLTSYARALFPTMASGRRYPAAEKLNE
jgi:hypothetical protein